jgi:hypothetical protein
MAKLQSPLTVQENFQNSDLLKHTHMCVCVCIYTVTGSMNPYLLEQFSVMNK